ncbi:ubiquitin family domain-containing protein [Ditylenchus destructor]|uniref:Ubiquitin family domain-containing protein n=1 Tax=Ditylenchus destructor TaxID=166010 RepID=A0AAD4MKU3_9BILA|nr:ubiquitin family domain-containing protein [Ditylenchus destructor]
MNLKSILLLCSCGFMLAKRPPQRPARPTNLQYFVAAAIYQGTSAGTSGNNINSNSGNLEDNIETSSTTTDRDLDQDQMVTSAPVTEALQLSPENVFKIACDPNPLQHIDEHRERMAQVESSGTLPLCSDVCRPYFPILAKGNGTFTCTSKSTYVSEEGTLFCLQGEVKPRKDEFSIEIVQRANESFTLKSVRSSHEGRCVKQKVAEKINYPAPTIHLVYNGKCLAGDKTMEDYGIKSGSTVHVVFRGNGQCENEQ